MIYSLQFHWRSRSPVPSAAHNTSRAEAYQCLILWLSLLLQLRIVLQILGEHEVRLHHQKTRAEGCQLKFWFINSKVCVGSEFAGRSIYRIDQKLIRRDPVKVSQKILDSRPRWSTQQNNMVGFSGIWFEVSSAIFINIKLLGFFVGKVFCKASRKSPQL